jgi:tetratricopeptide (TPR) repeat protein
LRSAASFYIESGDAERANDLLNRTSATSNDPWLAAAEIATASVADRHSKLAKRAKDQVVRGDFGGHDITELASAVATLELGYGNASRSKKLFRVSMADPTENAVAQAQWAVQHRHISLDLSQQREHTPLAFEAIARTSFTNADWAGCNDALKSWMKDQPFLVLPALIGSYIASELLEVPQEAYEFAKFGLKSNPNAAMLHNNLAVALAHLNRLDEAEQSVLRAIACSKPESVGDAIIIQATKGLVAFRRRNAETGRHLYESAITRAMDAGLKSLARRAYLYLIQEEVYNDPCVAPSALTALQPLDHETPSPVWSELLARVHNNIRVLAVIGDPYGLNRRSASDHCESALRLYGVKLANTGSDPAHFVNAIRPTGSIAPSRPDAPADVRQSFSGHFQTP